MEELEVSEEIIEFYKTLIDNVFSRCQTILSETFITKLIKKAEKVSSNGGPALLKGIEFSQNELQISMVLKNYQENEGTYTIEVISSNFNTILELIHKALSMLVGADQSQGIIKDAVKDVILKKKEIYESKNLGNYLPKFMIN